MNLNLCAVLQCTDQPFLRHPLMLCRSHALMVSLNVTDILHANALAGQPASDVDVEKAAMAPEDAWKQSSHQPLVYFVVNGDRVKIGTSTNITARISALCLRKSNAALLLNGGSGLEAALHQHFESDRISKTEWFILSKRIQDYMASRKAAAAALKQPPMVDEEASKPSQRVAIDVPTSPRAPTASDTILSVLSQYADPDGFQIVYIDRPALLAATGLKEKTFANALSQLERTGKIHRIAEGKNVRVALGRPVTSQEDTAA